MLPLLERAEHIFHRLPTDERVVQVGTESRQIVLPTDVITQEITRLAQTTIDSNAKQFLGVTVGILEVIGGNGIYVRADNQFNVSLGGLITELPENPTTMDLINATVMARSGLDFILIGNQPKIEVRTVFPNDDALSEINAIISQIPDQAKSAVIKGILEIVDDQLDQILDA